MKYVITGLIVAIAAGGVAIAQNYPVESPQPEYTINEPSEDVAEDRADGLQTPTDRNITREAVARFSLNPDQFTQTDGQSLYRTSCMACHMEDGKGATGAGHYPPLANNAKLVSKYYILSVLVNGYHGMPRFGDQMNDEQVAAVSNYVRQNFGNEFPDEIVAKDVGKLRAEGNG